MAEQPAVNRQVLGSSPSQGAPEVIHFLLPSLSQEIFRKTPQNMSMRVKQVHGLVKIGVGFIAGAAIAGGIATAAPSTQTTALQLCADRSTNAVFLAPNGNCPTNRTKISVGGNTIDVKTIAAIVTPSVVSIRVSSSAGGGTGSGWVYQVSNGNTFIVTNNHVVENAASSGTITIENSSGDQLNASLVGRDPIYDLAVVRVKSTKFAEVTLGDSTKLAVGDPVVAIGSPLGLASTVTSGIVSALNRPVIVGGLTSESSVNAIQTDAAINPGNSGGALLDGNGRLVGINSAIASLSSGGTGGSIGLGFAIPISEAKRVINEIIETGKSTRPILGVVFDPTYTGIGAKIRTISPGEAAERVGIPVNSIVRAVGGQKTPDRETAIVRLRSFAPGATITVLVDLPTGGQKLFSVKLGSAPSL